MQSIEHCTGGRTMYAVRACSTECNMHTERSCEAMAEWEMFEADLPNVDSLQTPKFFGSGTILILESSEIASQRRCRQERPSLRFKSTVRFFFKRTALPTFVMAGGQTSIGKALLLDGFLSYLDSRNLQTQVVLLGKN